MSELEVNLCGLSQGEWIEVQNVTNQTVAVNVSDAQSIDVVWGDRAQIDASVALQYIQSGQKEIDDYVSTSLSEALDSKQDVISDLSTIRSGAALGITAVQPSDLATVATTGSYDDLLNKPTIPAAQVNSDWNAVSGVAEILNKPTIPTVNNAMLTLTQGGVSKGTFTANASSDVTIDLDAGGSSKADIDLSNVNTSGKSIAAGWAMPSTSFETLTLGASGASYTAPKNGYFDLRKGANVGEYIKITGQVEIAISQATTDSAISCFIPAKKGESISVYYTASGTTYLFRFTYAEGDQ